MRTIYCLRSSTDRITRYVGQTGYPLHKRLKGHIHSAQRRSNALHDWVLSEAEAGTLEIAAVREVEDAEADRIERQIIQAERRNGILLNVRDGWYGRRDEKLLAPVVVSSDDNGTFLISCPSFPEVTTFAESADMIVRRANDAIEEAMFSREAA